ncbi:MAG: hypothetical protein NVS2B17_05150 [Candidatus Velthaea sp.]
MERLDDLTPPPALWAANLIAGHARLRDDFAGVDDPLDAIRRYRRFEALLAQRQETVACAGVSVILALLWHYRPSDDTGRIAKNAIWRRLNAFIPA